MINDEAAKENSGSRRRKTVGINTEIFPWEGKWTTAPVVFFRLTCPTQNKRSATWSFRRSVLADA
jgi:hypothetical protein